jgi:exodeoxyribonuclease V gamma subunit
VFIGKNSKREADAFEFSPVENSHGILEQLIDSYRQGLSLPLCFFPETSYAYALAVVRQGKSTQEALRRARQKWEGNNFSAGESEDAYIELCFRGKDPLDAEFEKTALALVSPMIINENNV